MPSTLKIAKSSPPHMIMRSCDQPMRNYINQESVVSDKCSADMISKYDHMISKCGHMMSKCGHMILCDQPG